VHTFHAARQVASNAQVESSVHAVVQKLAPLASGTQCAGGEPAGA